MIRPHGMEARNTALRVLSAVVEHRVPDPEDVQALRHYAPEAGADAPDELACEVIQRIIKVHLRVRAASPETMGG